MRIPKQRFCNYECNLWSCGASVLLCILFVGCGQGGSGPQRAELKGTVTYADAPVPFGSIRFVPDTAKGNDGPAGYATILDGKYDTAEEGKGVVGNGAYQVVIVGFSEPRPAQIDPDVPVPDTSLFPEFRSSVDLSTESGDQNFVVPVRTTN